MKPGWQSKTARIVSPIAALCAAAFALMITFTPAHANSVDLPQPIPDDIALLRDQPALGMRMEPLAPGQQPLTEALLANYIERQQVLRSLDIAQMGPQPALSQDVLMGYIARGSLGANNALSAIASFTETTPQVEPSVTSDMLASYIESGYQPTAMRVQHASSERDCLAQAIYHEARGETATGQLAVANVIVNRARSSQFPDSLCGVIYQNADKGRYKCQFTFACDGRDNAPGERRAWANSVNLAKEVYAEFASGKEIGVLPNTALYYHTTAVHPSWANTFSRVAAVDSHIFYAP